MPAVNVRFSVIVPVIVQASTVPVAFVIVSSVVPVGQLSFGTRSISATAVLPPPELGGLMTTESVLPGELVLPPPQAASVLQAKKTDARKHQLENLYVYIKPGLSPLI